MSINNPHVLGPVVLNPGDAGEVVIGDITTAQIRAGTETIRDVAAGSIFPQLSQISQVRPMGTFTTKNPRIFLENVGVVAKCPTGDDEIALYAAKRDCDGILAGAVHKQFLMTNFIIVPRTLTITHPNDAELSFEVYGVSESAGASSVVINSDVALPTTPSEFGTNERYEFGAMTVANTAIQGKRSFTLDFGTQIMQESADSEIYDSFVAVQQHMPRITISGVDPDWVKDSAASGVVALAGTAGTHVDTDLYLKQRREDVGDPKHIKFTTAAMWFADELFSGSSTEIGTTSIIGEPHDDGTNNPIVVLVDQAIS